MTANPSMLNFWVFDFFLRIDVKITTFHILMNCYPIMQAYCKNDFYCINVSFFNFYKDVI